MTFAFFWKLAATLNATLFLSLLVSLGSIFAPARGLAAEPTLVPEPRLIACPDCGHDVSRRAISCPKCGCPGTAIAAAVYVERAANSPLPVVQVRSDLGEGFGVVVADHRSTFVILSADLLAGAASLELNTLTKKEAVPYTKLEIAAEAPLVRLAISSSSVHGLPLGSEPSSSGTRLLLDTGLPCPLLDGQKLPFVAVLDLEDRVLALVTGAPGTATRAAHDVNEATKWLAVQPAEYRAQTALLRSLSSPDSARPLSAADRERLKSTQWLSPYLKKTADALLAGTPQP
jgi:hypothetical protein